jgi:hypothetical protein
VFENRQLDDQPASQKRTHMNGSTATTTAPHTIAAIVSSTQGMSNGGDSAPTTGAGTTTLDHNYRVTIEVDPDQRHDGHHQPFRKGYVLEHEDPIGYVVVGFIRAADGSKMSRSRVIMQLNEVLCSNGYLLEGAEERSTGNSIEGMPCCRPSSL